MTGYFVFKRVCYLRIFGNNIAQVILQQLLKNPVLALGFYQ